MKIISVNRVGPENINCKIGDFGLSLKMNKNYDGLPFHQSEPSKNDEFPLYLWAPECQSTPYSTSSTRFFTEYSDVFTFGMLIWEVFQIEECRKLRNCDEKTHKNCKKCQAYNVLDRDFRPPREEKLPLPTFLNSESNAAKELRNRVFKCWKYQSQESPHQKR